MPEVTTNRRLDLPRLGRRRLELDPDAFARLSERIARFLGTGRFLVDPDRHRGGLDRPGTLALVACAGTPTRSSSSPWRFSTQASYAAPLILLAQNRQDDRDRVTLEEDRSRAERTKADTEYLAREIAALRIALGEVATRDYLRGELDRITERLDELAARAPAKSGRRRT